MVIKGQSSISVNFDKSGFILIKQYSTEFGKPVDIFITLDQFELIGKYILNNISIIESNWNDGVENDSNS